MAILPPPPPDDDEDAKLGSIVLLAGEDTGLNELVLKPVLEPGGGDIDANCPPVLPINLSATTELLVPSRC